MNLYFDFILLKVYNTQIATSVPPTPAHFTPLSKLCLLKSSDGDGTLINHLPSGETPSKPTTTKFHKGSNLLSVNIPLAFPFVYKCTT